MMTNEALIQFVQNLVPGAEFEENPDYLIAIVPSTEMRALMEALRRDDSTNFNYMYCLTGVDYPEFLQVVYHLRSTVHDHLITVKATINNREDASIPTVCDIWRTAEFHEREAYDLFGIRFLKHPDLRRLLLDDDWVGWPMRKDYEDPINMIDY